MKLMILDGNSIINRAFYGVGYLSSQSGQPTGAIYGFLNIMQSLLDEEKPLPYPLRDAVIYYSGSTPAPEGLPIGACGPTTSGRMDPYTPRLHDLGLCATIGKGRRSPEVVEAIRRNGAVYLCAVGGSGGAQRGFLRGHCLRRLGLRGGEAAGNPGLSSDRRCGLPWGKPVCGGEKPLTPVHT